jgi:hypothetical protein
MTLPKIALKVYTVKLPVSGKTLKVRPFTVKEQKIMLISVNEARDKKTESNKSHMAANFLEVLQTCVQGEHNLSELSLPDFVFLMVKLREFSVGESIELNYTCPCGEKVLTKMELKNIKVKNNKKNGNYEKQIQITSDVYIKLDLPTVREAMLLADSDNEITEELAIHILAGCIKEISDPETVYSSKDYTIEEMCEFVEGFPVDKVSEIKDFFESLPYPYIKITANCPEPNGDIDVEVKDIFDFF